MFYTLHSVIFTLQAQFGAGPGDHVLLRQRLKTDDKPALSNWLGRVICAGPDGAGLKNSRNEELKTLEDLLKVC